MVLPFFYWVLLHTPVATMTLFLFAELLGHYPCDPFFLGPFDAGMPENGLQMMDFQVMFACPARPSEEKEEDSV
jgi:NADH:ubiquinone oxidoreductase subunit 3 (subunit A)